MNLYDRLVKRAAAAKPPAEPKITDYTWQLRQGAREPHAHLVNAGIPRTLCGRPLHASQRWEPGRKASRCKTCAQRQAVVKQHGWNRKHR
jgi:hypothetical protein